MQWNWHDEGFRTEPRLIRAPGTPGLPCLGRRITEDGQPRTPWRVLLDAEARHTEPKLSVSFPMGVRKLVPLAH